MFVAKVKDCHYIIRSSKRAKVKLVDMSHNTFI